MKTKFGKQMIKLWTERMDELNEELDEIAAKLSEDGNEEYANYVITLYYTNREIYQDYSNKITAFVFLENYSGMRK